MTRHRHQRAHLRPYVRLSLCVGDATACAAEAPVWDELGRERVGWMTAEIIEEVLNLCFKNDNFKGALFEWSVTSSVHRKFGLPHRYVAFELHCAKMINV